MRDYTVISLNRIYDNANCPLYMKQQTHVCDFMCMCVCVCVRDREGGGGVRVTKISQGIYP